MARQAMKKRTDFLFQLSGWVLFIVSALFFIGASLRAGDVLALLGSIAFFVACFIFLVPLIAHLRAGND
ncbi:MAG: hypothetical protein AAFW47_05470 [Pseudomonadota bacterium]